MQGLEEIPKRLPYRRLVLRTAAFCKAVGKPFVISCICHRERELNLVNLTLVRYKQSECLCVLRRGLCKRVALACSNSALPESHHAMTSHTPHGLILIPITVNYHLGRVTSDVDILKLIHRLLFGTPVSVFLQHMRRKEQA